MTEYNNKLALELAARLQVERLGEVMQKDSVFISYRANTVCIYGDWIELKVPAAFASEQSARLALYNYIISN